jgi:hypothetical protein
MNFGKIRVFRFKRAQGGAEAIPTNLGIDAAAQLVIVDEKILIILDVFVAIVHVRHRRPFLSAVIEAIGLVMVQPDAVRPSRPIPPASGPEPPTMVAPVLDRLAPVDCVDFTSEAVRRPDQCRSHVSVSPTLERAMTDDGL